MGESVAARPLSGQSARRSTPRRTWPDRRVRSRAMTVYGVHAGLQNTTTEELRGPLAAHRGAGLRLDLDLGPLLLGDPRRRRRQPGGGGDARRAGLRHPAGALRLARLQRRLPPSGRAGQRHLHDRPPLGRAGRPRPRRGLEPDRVRRLRHPVPAGRQVRMDQLEEAIQCVRGLLRDEVTDFDGPAGSSSTRPAASPAPCRPSCRSGSAARASGARCASRRVGRRLERPLRRARDVRPQARRPPRPLRRRRPRPGRDPHRGQPGPGLDGGEPPAAVRRPGRLRPARRAHGLRGARCWTASGSTSTPAPTRSTWRLRAPFDTDALDRFAAALGLS